MPLTSKILRTTLVVAVICTGLVVDAVVLPAYFMHKRFTQGVSPETQRVLGRLATNHSRPMTFTDAITRQWTDWRNVFETNVTTNTMYGVGWHLDDDMLSDISQADGRRLLSVELGCENGVRTGRVRSRLAAEGKVAANVVPGLASMKVLASQALLAEGWTVEFANGEATTVRISPQAGWGVPQSSVFETEPNQAEAFKALPELATECPMHTPPAVDTFARASDALVGGALDPKWFLVQAEVDAGLQVWVPPLNRLAALQRTAPLGSDEPTHISLSTHYSDTAEAGGAYLALRRLLATGYPYVSHKFDRVGLATEVTRDTFKLGERESVETSLSRKADGWTLTLTFARRASAAMQQIAAEQERAGVDAEPAAAQPTVPSGADSEPV